MWPFRKDPLKTKVDGAMKLIESESDDIRFLKAIQQARQQLVELPIEARPYLVSYLSHRSPWIRKYAGTALAVHMDDEVIRILLDCVRRGDQEVVSWYIAEIAKSAHPNALNYVKDHLMSIHSSARDTIFTRLRESKPDGGVDVLILGITQEDELSSLRERIKALAAYGELKLVADVYEEFSIQQKNWIINALTSVDEGIDISGRQMILRSLLLEDDEELVWDTFQKINACDLGDSTLRSTMTILLQHSNHRIRSRAEDYIEVIDHHSKNPDA